MNITNHSYVGPIVEFHLYGSQNVVPNGERGFGLDFKLIKHLFIVRLS